MSFSGGTNFIKFWLSILCYPLAQMILTSNGRLGVIDIFFSYNWNVYLCPVYYVENGFIDDVDIKNKYFLNSFTYY